LQLLPFLTVNRKLLTVNRNMDMYREIVKLLDTGRTGVLATLVARAGSGARSAGAKMVITDHGETIGSLGGGILDATIIHKAKEVLQTGEPALLSVEPEQDGGEVCGSTVQVFLELLTSGPAVVIIGGGHVGRSVAGIAGQAGFRVMLADDRTPEETGVDTIHCRPEAFFQDLPVGRTTCIVICTRSHALDYDVLQQALVTPAEYIGLLGSSRKKESFFSRLQQSGVAEKDIARIITPAGLDIGAQTPQEIGVSIVGQLIQQYRRR
jgi:xanthine dehydrogenase accessory factor